VNPQDAAKRALCLASLVLRAQAEYDLHPAPGDFPPRGPKTLADFVEKQNEWLRRQGLWIAASRRERQLFAKPLGTWTAQEVADGQWREEALAVIAWALDKRTPFPPYDQIASHSEAIKSVPPPSAAENYIATAKLRNLEDISGARDLAELWLWRARTTQIQRDGVKPPKGMTFEQIIAMTAKKAKEDGLFSPIDNDFPAFGKAYSKASTDEWYTLHSIATERLYALNWLCGYAEDWDQVPTET
jgi:hypothetical protein